MNEGAGSSSKTSLIMFVVGLVVGILGAVLVPGVVRPYLPDAIVGANNVVHGVVTGKRAESDRVLVTLPTGAGTVLVTFTEDLPEVDLMINEGDSLWLEIDEYAPFVQDPAIARVVTLSSPLGGDAAGADDRAGQSDVLTADSARFFGDSADLPEETASIDDGRAGN